MNLLKLRLRDHVYYAGLICLVISLFFFCLPFFGADATEHGFGLFVPSFAMTFIYSLSILVQRKRLDEANRIHYTILCLILSLISAFALNRTMNVFDDSANWFSVILVTSCINYLALAYSDVLPKWSVHLMSYIAGISWIAFVYLSIYLLPIYTMGLLGFFLLGVSLHSFVPLLFAIYSLRLVDQVAQSDRKYWYSFLSGLGSAIIVVIAYAMIWSSNKRAIYKAAYAAKTGESDLPAWIHTAQHVTDNFFTRKLLRTDLVYSIPHSEGRNFFWQIPGDNRLDETKKHDPLVMISEFLTGKLGLTNTEKMMVIRSMEQKTHEMKDRLWSGDHLVTDNVNTEVRLWPDCNISYTEKTITVTNSNVERWRRQEEALYTFYMPEGAVVTSLSLWVNGHEEKGILTTKEKADRAYTTIVGAEKRDPSVVHWQEGNSVTVRVFPVLPGESRMFKIGITAPLERIKGKLSYDNIFFKGPAWDDAREKILIDFEQPAAGFEVPASFTSMSRQEYSRTGKYEPKWSMVLNDPGLDHCSFSFGNNTYSLLPYQRKLATVQFNKLYLDINRSWSRSEFDQIIALGNAREIYVYDSALRKLTGANKEDCWRSLHSKQFSLFPLYLISEPRQSLLITKNPAVSPSLDDLEGSQFLEKTKNGLQNENRHNVYDLGNELSPYLRSFREFRVLQYDRGDISQLEGWLKSNSFPADVENDDDVIIHKSDMVIHKAQGILPASGPDHLMRLFSYNHIMQKLGRGQFLGRNVDDSLVDEARKAHVVTPVSSLVVLETMQDYERFDIKGANSSLGNASLNSKGAVPEPHEWAIIILSVMLMAWLVIRSKFRFVR